ncbi:hypothetical protein [Opitutus sp. GAS368]|uniref:hypothetical protein n=1 Tax=Opitutus sp. GAS368 TaxID=1882749 RepID=UPI00087BDE5F|nr:hypothetical protein [Opitutus sp. GAS368]SDR94186.1 hypothetical protein SAMN05444173_1403 [Opitutus sp. GAS368]
MIAGARHAQAILLFLVFAGVISAEALKKDELKAALADLTTNIESVDNAGFEKAGRVLINALSDTTESRLNYPADCLVWGYSPRMDVKPTDILVIAFMAGVTQERVYGDPKQALYRGWLNVAKYYQHYHADGTMEKLKAVEKLLRMEKAGALLAEAQKVQALHPELFDRIELDLSKHDLLNEHQWERCGTVSLPLPEGWSAVDKQYGQNTYTFLLTPKSGKKAEMTLVFLQHAMKSKDEIRDLTTRLERGLSTLLAYSDEKKITPLTLGMNRGVGLIGQLTGDALIDKPPLEVKHRVVWMAVGAPDAHCTMMGIMQMDSPDSPEAAEMMGIFTKAGFRRSAQSEVLEIEEVNGCYVLAVPVASLRLLIPRGELIEGLDNARNLRRSPRYFYFTDTRQGLQVSGWFESDKDYKGAKDFWKTENKGNRLNAREVSFEQSGPWDLIFYETALPEIQLNGKQAVKLTSTTMRAEYTAAGTWIDLHCSIIAPNTSRDSRATLRTFLQGVKVDGK